MKNLVACITIQIRIYEVTFTSKFHFHCEIELIKQFLETGILSTLQQNRPAFCPPMQF